MRASRRGILVASVVLALGAAWWLLRSGSPDPDRRERATTAVASAPAELPREATHDVGPALVGGVAEAPRTTAVSTPASREREAAPAPMPDPQPLTEADRAILDRFMAQTEQGFQSPARELHRRLREEPADPAWSPFATGTIEASMQARLPELANLRFDPPVCRTSICMLRAVSVAGTDDHGMRWQMVMQGLMNEPWWREHFDDAQTSMGMVDGQHAYLTYFFVRDGQ